MGKLLSVLRILLEDGGFATYILFATLIVLCVLSFERLKFLYFEYSYEVESIVSKIRKLVLKRDYTQAIQLCNSLEDAPEMSVLKAGLLASENGREAMKSALGGAVLEVSRKCERRTPLIALIAAAATLLGLLGTIGGLIKTFEAIANAEATEKARLLGNGISEAMYSTAFGLVIGVLAMVVHTLCTSQGDDIVGKAQDMGYKLITWIEESERGKKNG